MLKTIDHVNIVVSDLEESTRFFTQFGFTKTAGGQLSGEWIDIIVGMKNVDATYIQLALPGCSTKLELIHYISPISAAHPDLGKPNQTGIRHIAFEVDDIYAVVERLIRHQNGKSVDEQSEDQRPSGSAGCVPLERKLVLVSDVQIYEKTGKKLVYFHGPDGILLELAENPK